MVRSSTFFAVSKCPSAAGCKAARSAMQICYCCIDIVLGIKQPILVRLANEYLQRCRCGPFTFARMVSLRQRTKPPSLGSCWNALASWLRHVEVQIEQRRPKRRCKIRRSCSTLGLAEGGVALVRNNSKQQSSIGLSNARAEVSLYCIPGTGCLRQKAEQEIHATGSRGDCSWEWMASLLLEWVIKRKGTGRIELCFEGIDGR